VLIRQLPDQAVLVLLADGATGEGHGAQAAECFIRVMSACVVGFAQAADAMRQGFRLADQMIAAFAEACDTTGIALVVRGDCFVCASVGDSSVFMDDPGGIVELTLGQHRKPRIGSGIRDPVCREGRVTGPLLLASDGLAMSPEVAFALIQELGGADCAAVPARAVTRQAQRKGLFDDLAVVVLVGDTPDRGGGPERAFKG